LILEGKKKRERKTTIKICVFDTCQNLWPS
jgi:hypothetical protein